MGLEIGREGIPEISLTLREHNQSCYLEYDEGILHELAHPHLRVRICYPDGYERIYPVFQQNAGIYGEYSDYLRMHGCACCSLTSMLAAMRRNMAGFMPQDTITRVEKNLLPRQDYEKNYSRPVEKQMPVTLYGISRILKHEAIQCSYIMHFKRKTAMEVIDRHLCSGNPVIFETSRIRYKKSMIASIMDKKYAGSYHTMIMLGYDKDKRVIFTDSATRSWAGDVQRLKWAPLEELMDYMFPQRNTQSHPVYFHRRSDTGGFILVYSRDKIENMVQKNIDKMMIFPYN